MNYTELTQAIKDYTENTETTFVNNIASFVKQAEQRIYNEVQIPYLRKNVTGAATASNKYLQTPTDFLAAYSMAAILADGTYEFMLNKDVTILDDPINNANNHEDDTI